MSWTYSDWITQGTRAARVSRLRLHIQEVSDRVSEEQSVGGDSFSTTNLEKYLAGLHKKLEALDPNDNIGESASTRSSPFVVGQARRSA